MKVSLLTKTIVFLLVLFVLAIIIIGASHTSIASLRELFSDKEFIGSVFFSIKTSVIATVLSFIFGVPSGLYLSRSKGKVSCIIDAIFDIPLVVPPLIVGVLLLTLFNIPIIKDFYDFIFTTSGAVVAQFFVAFPLTVKAAKSTFDMIPDIYEMTAMTLGSKPFKSFYDTTFKIAFPGILSGILLTWLRSMGEFGATLMVGGGIPFKTENIPINIYINMTSGNFQKGVAASVISIAIAFCFIIVIKVLFLSKKKSD
ncbi:MAG: ABC transporter permease subunit [bacterium]|nr:ABC transporter permease subunit [bacterium]